MEKHTFSFLKAAVAAVLFIVGGHASSNLQAQQEEKLTREPVFRQAKLPGQSFQQRVLEQEQPAQRFITPHSIVPASDAALDSGSVEKQRISAIPAAVALGNTPIANNNSQPTQPKHPLDNAITIAQDGLENIQANVFDYTALMVKRERVNGTLGDVEYLKIKVRNQRETEQGAVPLSIYMSFLKPKAVKGREVIWVRGQNDNKLSAHETGMMGFRTFHLDPDGMLAMRGNRYPIYEAGLENLIVRLIEKATRDRSAGDCQVQYVEGAKINNRSCSMIEVVHNDRREPYEFHKAQVFIDDELNLPVRYASYDWPTTPGGKAVLMEEYTYVNIALNVGLTDMDFDIRNPEYNYRESK